VASGVAHFRLIVDSAVPDGYRITLLAYTCIMSKRQNGV
jgi:hypothetical protein